MMRRTHCSHGEFAPARGFFDTLENKGERMLTQQDKALYSLCRPERLLELTYRFTLFDAGVKKIARYQQFFVIRSIMKRIMQTRSRKKKSWWRYLANSRIREVINHGNVNTGTGIE